MEIPQKNGPAQNRTDVFVVWLMGIGVVFGSNYSAEGDGGGDGGGGVFSGGDPTIRFAAAFELGGC
jgi:hypothetical protein